MAREVATESTHSIKHRLVMKISVSSTYSLSKHLRRKKKQRSLLWRRTNDHLPSTSKPRRLIRDSCAKFCTITSALRKNQTSSATKQTKSAPRHNRSSSVRKSQLPNGSAPKITSNRPSWRSLKSRCSTHPRGDSSHQAARITPLNSPQTNSPANVYKSKRRWRRHKIKLHLATRSNKLLQIRANNCLCTANRLSRGRTRAQLR